MASEPTSKPNDLDLDASRDAQTTSPRIHVAEPAIQPRTLGEVLPSAARTLEPGNSSLNEVAESVGGTLGHVVAQAQRIAKEAERAAEGWTERARDAAVNEQREAADKFSQAKDSVAAAGQEAKQWAGDVVQRTRARGSDSLRLMRARARQLANEYPLQTIAVSAGVAFLIGVLLRIRRSNNYE
jgi:ElaB/YqjD/DUF883 family membrane-anchored ribosome-binding protein